MRSARTSPWLAIGLAVVLLAAAAVAQAAQWTAPETFASVAQRLYVTQDPNSDVEYIESIGVNTKLWKRPSAGPTSVVGTGISRFPLQFDAAGHIVRIGNGSSYATIVTASIDESFFKVDAAPQTTQYQNGNSSLALLPNGEGLFAWADPSGNVWFAYRAPGGTFDWANAKQIFPAGTSVNSNQLRVSVAPDGSAAIASATSGRYSTAYAGAHAPATAPVFMASSTPLASNVSPVANSASDPSGMAVQAWREDGNPCPVVKASVLLPGSGAYSVPQTLGPAGVGQADVGVAIDPTDHHAAVTWTHLAPNPENPPCAGDAADKTSHAELAELAPGSTTFGLAHDLGPKTDSASVAANAGLTAATFSHCTTTVCGTTGAKYEVQAAVGPAMAPGTATTVSTASADANAVTETAIDRSGGVLSIWTQKLDGADSMLDAYLPGSGSTTPPVTSATPTAGPGPVATPSPAATTPVASPAPIATTTPAASAAPTQTKAQVAKDLADLLDPAGPHLTATEILHAGSYGAPVTSAVPGTYTVTWYHVSGSQSVFRSTKKTKPVVLASGHVTFAAAGQKKLKLKLTRAGRASFKRGGRVHVTATGHFTPAGSTVVVAVRKRFALKP